MDGPVWEVAFRGPERVWGGGRVTDRPVWEAAWRVPEQAGEGG